MENGDFSHAAFYLWLEFAVSGPLSFSPQGILQMVFSTSTSATEYDLLLKEIVVPFAFSSFLLSLVVV